MKLEFVWWNLVLIRFTFTIVFSQISHTQTRKRTTYNIQIHYSYLVHLVLHKHNFFYFLSQSCVWCWRKKSCGTYESSKTKRIGWNKQMVSENSDNRFDTKYPYFLLFFFLNECKLCLFVKLLIFCSNRTKLDNWKFYFG